MDERWEQVARVAAFEFVDERSNGGVDPVAWSDLESFQFDRTQIPLVGASGIWKPKVLSLPISIMTAAPKADGIAPYDDEATPEGFLRYKYRGTDPNHWNNALVREAMSRGVPMIYFQGVARGLYHTTGALIIDDDPDDLSFLVAPTPLLSIAVGVKSNDLDDAQRRYYLRTVKQRADQSVFRARVLTAYRKRCAVCELRHPELLDAAHIIPDSQGGPPVVRNGISMCKIHHAAFDHNIFGIRPDLAVEVRADVLHETDGPMLKHGLQELHGRQLVVPRKAEWRPGAQFVEQRYEAFVRAS